MNVIWFYSFIGVLITSLVSLAGILALVIKKNILREAIFLLVALASGVMLGEVFIHIVPEIARETGFGLGAGLYFLAGILFFYILEEFLAWRHCHDIECDEHPKKLARMNLVGDGLHNLLDGMMIAGSFLVSRDLGVATTIAVAMHEIPQELGDFGVLLAGGFSIKKAVFYNFISAMLAILGMVLALVIGGRAGNLAEFILPFTGGGFIYIVGSGIIPELHKESRRRRWSAFLQLLAFAAGVGVMAVMR